MTKLTLKDRLLNYLQRHEGEWVASGNLQRLALNAGYTAQNAGRRLRELQEDGILSVEYRERNHAYYRYTKGTITKQVSSVQIINGLAVETLREVEI